MTPKRKARASDVISSEVESMEERVANAKRTISRLWLAAQEPSSLRGALMEDATAKRGKFSSCGTGGEAPYMDTPPKQKAINKGLEMHLIHTKPVGIQTAVRAALVWRWLIFASKTF